jgi:hypothetical protein
LNCTKCKKLIHKRIHNRTLCHECYKKVSRDNLRAYRYKNREQEKIKQKIYYQENKESIKAKVSLYRKKRKEKFSKSIVYFIKTGNFIKIGKTNNLFCRIRSIRVDNPYKIELLGYIENNEHTEKELHWKFREYHKKGEWFYLSQEILDYVNNNTLRDNAFLNAG